jgi:hypothetical protein
MRLLAAAVFVYIGMMLLAFAVAEMGFLGWIAFAPGLLLLIVLALWLFGPWRKHHREAEERRVKHAAEIERLRADGRLVEQTYAATRAVEIEEFEDEGVGFLLELADGSLLFLHGQYLYDFEPREEQPGVVIARRFPCTRFTMRRHPEQGYVVDLECGGDTLDPAASGPPLRSAPTIAGRPLEDGDVVVDRAFNDLVVETRAREGGAG